MTLIDFRYKHSAVAPTSTKYSISLVVLLNGLPCFHEFSHARAIRGAVCSKTHDSPLYIKRCSIYISSVIFIISTVYLLYRQWIYYIDSRFIISTVDLLYRQRIYVYTRTPSEHAHAHAHAYILCYNIVDC